MPLRQPNPPKNPLKSNTVAGKPDALQPEIETPTSQPQPKPVSITPQDTPARQIKISTPLYEMTLSENGAAVVSMVLNNYRETVDPKSAKKELIPTALSDGTLRVDLEGKDAGALVNQRFSADIDGNDLDVTDRPSEIQFRSDSPSGISIIKTYRFSPESYLVGLSVEVYNGSQREIDARISIALNNMIDQEKGRYAFEGPSALINGSLEQVKIKKIEDTPVLEGDIRWAAIETQYFMESIIPNETTKGQLKLEHAKSRVTQRLVLDNPALTPQDRQKHDFDIFMGPKSLSLLRSFDNDLERAVDFGWVDILAKPCLWFMNFIYGFIPNYGFAIIVLTIVTRMIFWPLANKSYKSMGEMRKLQPLMKEIREKYKNDKQRMNQEMMALYRTYKINPMGGCLPMLIQLPVFFALYRMLYQAIELRHAPFIWWINDLSAPDRLFRFDFKIPFMQEPYGIPVLTLVMAATMLIQQKMTPTPGDPAQAKMMMFMPLIFLFIFINFSSGLVLYWMISNIISIAQQYYIHKKVA